MNEVRNLINIGSSCIPHSMVSAVASYKVILVYTVVFMYYFFVDRSVSIRMTMLVPVFLYH